MVKEQLKEVQARIKNACIRAGRNPEEVTLIAVSKTKPGGHACQIGADRTVRGTGISQCARRETGILTEPGGLLDDADNQMRHGEFHPCRPLRTIGVADDDMQPAEFIRIRVRFVTCVDHGARPRRRR